jgi:hypothetical protein
MIWSAVVDPIREAAPHHLAPSMIAIEREGEGGDIGRYLAIRQPNSTTAAPTTAAITDVSIPPPSASSMAT